MGDTAVSETRRHHKRAAGKAARRQRNRPERRADRPPPGQRGNVVARLWQRIAAPRPIVRLEALRILVPLCILGFMSSRVIHAGHWIGTAGFSVPDMGGDWRQPLYLPPLPVWMAWSLAGLMVTSGLSLAAGFLTRVSAAAFAFTMVWVALADRLASFTVTKLGTVLVLALLVSPCGARYGVDAWRRRRRDPDAPVATHVAGTTVLFFQLALVVMYCSSGACKARGDWLTVHYVLWTHFHDSYATVFTRFLVNYVPAPCWNVLQYTTLAFEALSPIWFGLKWTRPAAVVYGLGMHAIIGLAFGPVIWFSGLMMSLLACGFFPAPWLEKALARLEPDRPPDRALAKPSPEARE